MNSELLPLYLGLVSLDDEQVSHHAEVARVRDSDHSLTGHRLRLLTLSLCMERGT